MFEKSLIWLVVASGVALMIAHDMQRLAVHRVGVTRTGWLLVCAGLGPFAGVIYLFLRRTVWRELIESTWKFVGDEAHPLSMRRRRLIALRRAGLIGAPVFRRCLALLEAGYPPPKD